MAPLRRLAVTAALCAYTPRADVLGLQDMMDVSLMLDTFVAHPHKAENKFITKPRECGINGVLNVETGSYEKPEDRMKLQCHKRMTTDCSVSYYPMRCPDECGYLVPNVAFSCLFECVKARECSQSNPNRAYPNNETGLCEPCEIAGCKICSEHAKCKVCHEHFHLGPNNESCIFDLDEAMHWDRILTVVGVLVGGLVLFGIVWFAWKGPHPNWKINMVAVLRARRHRHLCKVYNWQLDNCKTLRTFIGLAENMHKRNVIGLGVALFYNNIVFMCLVAFIFWVCTYVLYESSDVSQAMGQFEDRTMHLIKNMVAPPKYHPAIILSPLAICGRSSGAQTQAQIMGYAKNNFIMIGILYLVTFMLSLTFGYLQRRAATKFDDTNTTMSDFALLITGLPEDATSEPELKSWLETEFRKVVPGLWKRPDKVLHRMPPEKDLVTEVPPSELEVFGVSLCYNYRDQWADVDDILWKEMEHMEVEMHNEANYDKWQLNENNTTAAERHLTLKQVQDANRKKVTEWFEGDKKLKGTGEMFCVFKYLPDKYRLIKYMEAHPDFLRHPSAPNTPLKISHVFSEPNCVAWWFVGLSRSVLIKRTAMRMLYILLVIGLVQLFIVIPYAWYILLPYATTGSAAGGMKTTIAGMVLGNVNGILFITNFMTAVKLGYTRKDMMDIFVLIANTILVMINTCFNIGITVIMVMSQNNVMEDVLLDLVDGKTLKAVGTENAIARNLYQMMYPGTFFMGMIMSMIMAGWVPFIWNTFLMKMIYIWKCFPDPLLKVLKAFLPWAPEGLDYYPFRSAEKAFEPWEVPICGNYADQIVTPTICFAFLFFASPYTHKCFLGMLLWALFEYVYFRYMHLRYHKTCWYTTSRLDSFNNFLWAMPLSVIAAAWLHWGFRSETVGADWTPLEKAFAIMLVFWVSCLLWLVSYRFLINPFKMVETDDEQTNRTVEELSQETVYTWFNCNSPFVLKCKYYYLDSNGKRIPSRIGNHPIACGEDENEVRFFEVGKQGLFAKPERQRLVYKLNHSLLEFETWFEKILAVMDTIARLCRCGKMARSQSIGPSLQQAEPPAGQSEVEMGLLSAVVDS